jgi:hypothetical protein
MRVIDDVFPGDVWYFPANANLKMGGIYTVATVDRQKNLVWFNDGGWSDYRSMVGDNLEFGKQCSEDKQWILLNRVIAPKTQITTQNKSVKIFKKKVSTVFKNIEKQMDVLRQSLAKTEEVFGSLPDRD